MPVFRSPRSRTLACARRCRRSPPTSRAFRIYLDYTHENHLPVAWAVGAFYVEQGKNAFMRFYDFLESIPAHVLVPLLPAAGASQISS